MFHNAINNLISIWGGIIFIFVPIVVALTGHIIKTRTAAGKPSVPAKIMRYLISPTVVIYLVCYKVFELPRSHVSIKITETILVLFLISFAFHFINYFVFSEHNIFTKKETIPKLGRDVLHFILVVIVGTCVFSAVWGVDLGNLLTALGVSSLVIGLALQEPLANLFNGIALLMAKPFLKGDWISVGNETGKVVEFNWRSLIIVTRFNEMIIIPNNVIGKEKIKNFSKPKKIHAELVKVGFSYDDNPQKVKKILKTIAVETEGVLSTPCPLPLTLSYDDFYITYGLKFFIEDFEDVILLKDAVMTKIYDAAHAEGISIPFPIREIHMKDKQASSASSRDT